MPRPFLAAFATAIAIAIATSGAAHAQHAPDPGAGNSSHAMEAPSAMAGSMTGWKGDQGPVSQAYAEANLRMHGAMDIEFTGNADRDFAIGMIAHHQGAIDMARIAVEHGSDPEIRKFAEDVIAAQSAEIAFLRQWLDAHPAD